MEAVVDIYVPPRGWPRDSAQGPRHFHPTVEGVEWTEGVHGCSEASFTVKDPITVAALTEDCPVWISDPRDGAIVWTGNVARNGLQRTTFGDSAVVRCTGNTGDLYSTYWSLPYKVLEDYSGWERETIKYHSGRNWEVGTGARPMSPPWDAVNISINEGEKLYPGNGGRMQYIGHYGSDMYIGGITYNSDAGTGLHPWDGTANSFLRAKLQVGDKFFDNQPLNQSWSTSSAYVNRRASGVYGTGADWPAWPEPSVQEPRNHTGNYLILCTSFEDSVGGVVENENCWYAASRMCIIGQRVDRWGNNTYPAVTRVGLTQINAGQVAEDLVGRTMVNVVDPTLVTINHTSGWNLGGSVNYRDPASPGEILDDMELLHPDHHWRVGMRSLSSGLAPFSWGPWDTEPRYIIDGDAVEIDLDGAPDPLYNRVTVRWEDWKQRPRSTSFDADPAQYPDIASLQGWHEPQPIDLASSLSGGDSEFNAWANVERIGEKYLSQVATRFPAGTITVTGPVLDRTTQTLVPPSQLRAGTTLVITSDEPPYVHRVQEVTHAGVDEATLSIGRPRLDLDKIIDIRGHGRK